MPGNGDREDASGEIVDLGRELSALAFRFAEDAAACGEIEACPKSSIKPSPPGN